jgi:hypothetical protein
VKRCRRYSLLDGPIHGSSKNVLVVIHAEDEAPVDHDAEVMESVGDRGVVASEVLALVAARQIARRERLEADKQAAQPKSTFFSGVLCVER